jgi:hypothetical protein
MASYENLIAEINKNNRVCPQPLKWNELYELLLSNKKELNNKPSIPLILAAWWDTPIIAKKLRLRDHIDWSLENGCLNAVYTFLVNLKEDEWYYGN